MSSIVAARVGILSKVFPLQSLRRLGKLPHLFLSTVDSAPLLRASHRSKSFPALSNSYKAPHPRCLSFEWFTDGTPGAYQIPDEVARNGASQKELRPEVFLGAPLHFVWPINLPHSPYASVKGSRTSTPAWRKSRATVSALRREASNSTRTVRSPSLN